MRRRRLLPTARLSTQLFAPATCVALLALAGCHKNSQTAANQSDSTESSFQPAPPPAVVATAQHLYESKRYTEAKTQAIEDSQRLTGHDKEVALLTAGLSAHAMQQYDDAATLLIPLTRSEDSRIAGRAKSAIDYIGIERARKSAALSTVHPTRAPASTAFQTVPRTPAPVRTTGQGGFTLQAGVFASIANARQRASQIRNQAERAGLGEPRIVPDAVGGSAAYAVQVGSFNTKQAANAAKSRVTGQVVVMALP